MCFEDILSHIKILTKESFSQHTAHIKEIREKSSAEIRIIMMTAFMHMGATATEYMHCIETVELIRFIWVDKADVLEAFIDE